MLELELYWFLDNQSVQLFFSKLFWMPKLVWMLFKIIFMLVWSFECLPAYVQKWIQVPLLNMLCPDDIQVP